MEEENFMIILIIGWGIGEIKILIEKKKKEMKGRKGVNGLMKKIEIWEIIEIMLVIIVGVEKEDEGNIRDRILVGDVIEELKEEVKEEIEEVEIISIKVDEIMDFIRRIDEEMKRMEGNREKKENMKNKKLLKSKEIEIVSRIKIEEFKEKILKDRKGLKKRDRLEERKLRIEDGGNKIVRWNFKEKWLKMIEIEDIDIFKRVREEKLIKNDDDFEEIRSRKIIKLNRIGMLRNGYYKDLLDL